MEVWKDIEGYEGLYQVSNEGRVRSIARVDRFGRRVSERIMKPNVQKSGYHMVQLCRNGVHEAKLIHRLVALSFIPKPDDKNEINHIDENPANNRADNLEWCGKTFSLNIRSCKAARRIFWKYLLCA